MEAEAKKAPETPEVPLETEAPETSEVPLETEAPETPEVPGTGAGDARGAAGDGGAGDARGAAGDRRRRRSGAAGDGAPETPETPEVPLETKAPTPSAAGRRRRRRSRCRWRRRRPRRRWRSGGTYRGAADAAEVEVVDETDVKEVKEADEKPGDTMPDEEVVTDEKNVKAEDKNDHMLALLLRLRAWKRRWTSTRRRSSASPMDDRGSGRLPLRRRSSRRASLGGGRPHNTADQQVESTFKGTSSRGFRPRRRSPKDVGNGGRALERRALDARVARGSAHGDEDGQQESLEGHRGEKAILPRHSTEGM